MERTQTKDPLLKGSLVTSIATTAQGSHDYQRQEWLNLKAYFAEYT